METGDFAACTVNMVCPANFTATGGTPPYTWSIAPGTSFPPGLTLNLDGTLGGKPTQYYTGGVFAATSEYNLSVVVTDSANPALQASGTDGLPVASGLKIVSVSLPVATLGVAYQSPAPVCDRRTASVDVERISFGSGREDRFRARPDLLEYLLRKDRRLQERTPCPTRSRILKRAPAATASVNVTLVVMAPLIATATQLSASSPSAGTGMGITLTAHVTANGATPSGTVIFAAGGTTLGTVTVDATGTASLPASFAAAGTYTITATYSGDAYTAGSISNTLSETVVTPGVSAVLNPGTLKVTAGASGTLSITVNSTGGYTGAVAFSCGSLPAHVSCSFNPPSVTLSSSVTTGSSVLTISTGPNAVAMTMPGFPPPVKHRSHGLLY